MWKWAQYNAHLSEFLFLLTCFGSQRGKDYIDLWIGCLFFCRRIPYIPSWNSRAARRMILSRTMSESFFGLGCVCWLFFTVRFWKCAETRPTKRGNRKYRDTFEQNLDHYPSKRTSNRTVCSISNATQLVSIYYLNPFFIAASLDNSVNIDTGDVDVLCSERPDVHHLLHLCKDAEWWALPSPVTRLTTLQIKAWITARVDETMLPENSLCLWAVKFNT